MKHIAWDHEESTISCYHIYPCTDEGDTLLRDQAVLIESPQTAENDQRIQRIVDNLNMMADKK